MRGHTRSSAMLRRLAAVVGCGSICVLGVVGTVEGGDHDGHEKRTKFWGRQQWWLERHRGPDGAVHWNAHVASLAELDGNVRSGKLRLASTLASMRAIEGDRWLPIGPRPVQTATSRFSGRVTSIAVHPLLPDTVYIGAAQGGVWKTSDGGGTWTALTDDQNTLAVGKVVLDPSDPETVYVGTGESHLSCGSYAGVGILKSVDGGSTWTTIGQSVFQDTSIGALAVHPTDPDTLWAGNGYGFGGLLCHRTTGSFGLWKTTDDGTTWNRVLGPSQIGLEVAVFDIVLSPDNPDTLFAAVDRSGIWKSTDGGASWTRLSGGLPTSDLGRFELAIDPGNPDILFTAAERYSDGTLLGVWRSPTGGSIWLQHSIPLFTSCGGHGLNDLCTHDSDTTGQCWYDLDIAVQPGGRAWLGGIGLASLPAGSTSWTAVCPDYQHVDQHAFAFGSDGRVWLGNDGGVWSTSNDGATWDNRNSNLQITQFYPGAALDPTRSDVALAGSQDNGTSRFTGGDAWARQISGDGSACAIDAGSPATTWYVTSQRLNIRKTTDGGATFQSVVTGLVDARTNNAPFIGQFTNCPANSRTLIAGSDNVWHTTDGAASWSSNSPDPIDGSGITALTFASAVSSCSAYAVGTRAGGVFVTTDSGQSWNSVSDPAFELGITDLAFDPTTANTLYVATAGFSSPHLFRTLNALDPTPSWTPIDAGIPNTPINAVLVDPESPSVLYAGSDLGVFKSIDNGASWIFQDNGIPKLAVYDLVADVGTRSVIAFTHGRGAFRLNLVCTPPAFDGVQGVADADSCDPGVQVSWDPVTAWGQLATTGTYEVQRFSGSSCQGQPAVVASGIPPGETMVLDSTGTGGASGSYRVMATNDCGTPLSSEGVQPCSDPIVDQSDTVPCSSVSSTLRLGKMGNDVELVWDPVGCQDLAAYQVWAAMSVSATFPSGWTQAGSVTGSASSVPLDSPWVGFLIETEDGCGNGSGGG